MRVKFDLKRTRKERLLLNRRIDNKTGCWLWTGTLSRAGYGCVGFGGKTYQVHRVSYEEFIGPIKNLVLHKIICPNRRCFNPEHLYDGTYYENVMDSLSNKTHHGVAMTVCKNGHEFDTIFWGKRVCSKCKRDRDRKRYELQQLEKGKIVIPRKRI